MARAKKHYFISDVHLGLYPTERSLEREKVLVAWLDSVKDDMEELYLMGDIFDFWHEYRRVVPRGFTRFLGKLSELADRGIAIHYFTGNHDIWVYDYLPQEIGLTVYRKHITRDISRHRFFIGHGDGIGPGDHGYKLLKRIFTCKPLQWFFARLHPNFSVWLGLTWSKRSRYAKGIVAEPYNGDEGEFQVVFARETLQHKHFDFFIFGHRHIPFVVQIGQSLVVNLGDWINNFTYGVYDGESFQLHSIYPEKEENILRRKL